MAERSTETPSPTKARESNPTPARGIPPVLASLPLLGIVSLITVSSTVLWLVYWLWAALLWWKRLWWKRLWWWRSW